MSHVRRSLVVGAVVVVMVLLGSVVGAGAQSESARFGPGDDFYAPIPMPTWADGNWQGNNFNATTQFCEPNHAGVPGGASVWFRLPAHRHWDRVTVTTNYSNFDTTLAVYRGNNLCNLRRIASNDDINYPVNKQSRVVFNTAPRVVYRIAVDGYNGARGNIRLNFRRVTF